MVKDSTFEWLVDTPGFLPGFFCPIRDRYNMVEASICEINPARKPAAISPFW
jgi:hypothetical protein